MTSEIAGRALKGDSSFERHVLNARGYVPVSSRTLLSGRGMFGFSNGTLPAERLFAVGGIGSVHGYGFKESGGGTGMTLLNVEYSVSLSGHPDSRGGVSVFGFFDAGRVTTSLRQDAEWLRGVGFGVGSGGVRLEVGFRANDIPRSRQIPPAFLTDL